MNNLGKTWNEEKQRFRKAIMIGLIFGLIFGLAIAIFNI